MEEILGTHPETIQIHLKNPRSAYSPGDTILGTIVFRPKEPLSISEFRIQFQAGLRCFVYRKLFLYALWTGGGWLFRKYIILIDGPTTLPAGEYHFPFALPIPLTSEPTKLGSMRKWAFSWPARDPFPGTERAPHPLPPTAYTASKHLLGYQNGRVQYAINVSTKRGADAGFFSTKALNSLEVPVVTTRAAASIDGTQMRYDQAHEAGQGPVVLHLFVPREVQQGSVVALRMSVEGAVGVRLVALTVNLTAKSKVRGKHVLAGRFTATSKEKWLLVSWRGREIPLGPGQVGVSPEASVPGNVPVRFATWTMACVGHTLDVEYSLMVGVGGQEKEVKGSFRDVAVNIVSWKPPNPQAGQYVDTRGWFAGQVLDKFEYDEHQTKMGRK